MLIDAIDEVREFVARFDEIEIRYDEFAPPASAADLAELEESTDRTLPHEYVSLVRKETAGGAFGWRAPDELFGPKCRLGMLHLLMPKQIAELWRDNASSAAELAALMSMGERRARKPRIDDR
jgi:hypothetical protein